MIHGDFAICPSSRTESGRHRFDSRPHEGRARRSLSTRRLVGGRLERARCPWIARARAARRRVNRRAGQVAGGRASGEARLEREPVRPLPGVLDALGDELAHVSRYPIEAYAFFRADVARALGFLRLHRAGRHAGAYRHGRGDLPAAGRFAWFSPPSPSTSTGSFPSRVARRARAPMCARGIDLEALSRRHARWTPSSSGSAIRTIQPGPRSSVESGRRSSTRCPSGAWSSPTRPMRTTCHPIGGSGASATSSTGSRSSCCAASRVLRPRRASPRLCDRRRGSRPIPRHRRRAVQRELHGARCGRASLLVGDEVVRHVGARLPMRAIPQRGADRDRSGAVPVGGELCPRPGRRRRRAARAATPRRRHPRAGGFGARPARTYSRDGRPAFGDGSPDGRARTRATPLAREVVLTH